MNIRGLCGLTLLLTAILYAPNAWAAADASPANDEPSRAEITILYDAFGKSSAMKKDWGFLHSFNTAESASSLIPATTPTSLRTM